MTKAKDYILIVEDDEGVREGLRELIANEGYCVETCADGRVAMNHLASVNELPHIIVLDFGMPHMDGWEFLDERKKQERLHRIPVLGMSASQRLVDGHESPDVDEILTKPFQVEAILRSIERHW